MKRRFDLRRSAGLLTAAAAMAAVLVFAVPAAFGAAVSTTDDPGFTANSYTAVACQQQNGVNCNQYQDKRDVFLSGLPVSASLGAGTYFFAVLDPGGQKDPNDGTGGNLSTSDTYVDREFQVASDGTITNLGTHSFDSANNKLQLAPFDDTSNPGGVYIMAVCAVPSQPTPSSGTGAPGVTPKDCKYDAFKVIGATTCTGDNCNPKAAGDLQGLKTAAAAFTREFNWTISKSVDACQITVAHPNGCDVSTPTKTLNYTVTVTKDGGTNSGWNVHGTITVTNGNAGDVFDVVVSDATDVGGTCVVQNDTNTGLSLDPSGDTLPAGDTAIYPYTCTFTSNPGSGTNTATVTWNPELSDGSESPDSEIQPTAGFTFGDPTTVVHDCVNVSDTATVTTTGSGSAGVPSPARPNEQICASKTYSYSVVLTVRNGCVKIDNTAAFAVTDKDGDPADDAGSSEVIARACGPVTGGLTMGFWQNKNGQTIIKSYCGGTSGTSLYTYLVQYHPFSDVPTTCGTSTVLGDKTNSGIVGWVYTIIKNATCTSTSKTCNTMLRAQMLATALDVYFSTPNLGGNKINAPTPLGGVNVDLTNICKMIDGTSSSSCSGSYENTGSAFGAPPTCQTVSQLLQYQNTSDPSADAGANWYSQVKATQVLAKDTFDSINNQVAFSC